MLYICPISSLEGREERDLRRGLLEECPKEDPYSALEDEIDYLKNKIASLLAESTFGQGTEASPSYSLVL